MIHATWHTVDAAPDLMESDVHVWWAPLAVSDAELSSLRATLSAAEQERADRYLEPERGRAAVVSRGVLRRLLASYLGRTPVSLELMDGAHGKPALACTKAGLHFNVSHAGDALLVAVALDRSVGVDVEDTQRDVEIEGLAARYFTAEECATVLRSEEPRAAFFRAWVRKEAVLKARGTGFETTEHSTDGWRIVDLQADERYPAAVVVPVGPLALRLLRTRPSD